MGWGAARGTPVLFGMGKGDRGLAEPPVSLLNSLSTGPGRLGIAGRWRGANESQSTSSASESSKGRTERSNKPSLRALVQNLIMRAQLWLDKLVSFRFAR